MKEGYELINKKIEFFKERNIKVHVCCGANLFYNGTILSVETEKDFMILVDDKVGEVPVMFEEIEKIEPCRREG